MKLATAERTALIDVIKTDLAGGFVGIYNGTQPANPNTALSGNTLLGTLPLNTPAGTTASGVLTIDVTGVSDTDADASGTPTFVRLYKSDHTTVVGDCTAAVGSGEFNFVTAITLHNQLPLSSASFTVPIGS
jgi:hypothetical protein